MKIMPMQTKGITFGRFGDDGDRDNKIVKTTSNYYVGCSSDPNFKYERTLDSDSAKALVKNYGENVAESVSAALKSGASTESIEKMLKAMGR